MLPGCRCRKRDCGIFSIILIRAQGTEQAQHFVRRNNDAQKSEGHREQCYGINRKDVSDFPKKICVGLVPQRAGIKRNQHHGDSGESKGGR